MVPIDSRTGDGEKQVYDAFKRGDKTAGLRFREDATTAPEVFSPLCSFTAELLLKETASDMAVGWYNVIPNATTKPADTDIVEVIPPRRQTRRDDHRPEHQGQPLGTWAA